MSIQLEKCHHLLASRGCDTAGWTVLFVIGQNLDSYAENEYSPIVLWKNILFKANLTQKLATKCDFVSKNDLICF